jgi:hypothetical protein
VKNFLPLVVLFVTPCLYPQAGLFFRIPRPDVHGPEYDSGRLTAGVFRSAGNDGVSGAGFSGAFGGSFRSPDWKAGGHTPPVSRPLHFESPRPFHPRNLASTSSAAGSSSVSGTENPVVSTPLWLKDLRRAEIVAFGSFPLTMFWTSFFMDLYRTASHGWDNRYAPWPFKGAGAVAMTNQELSMMFTIAISSSVVIAIVDHFILRYRRSRAGDAGKPVRLDRIPKEPPASSVLIPEG